MTEKNNPITERFWCFRLSRALVFGEADLKTLKGVLVKKS